MPSHGLRSRAATMRRPAPAHPWHQVRRLQLRLDPAVAPRPAVRELQMLVEVLHVPPRIVALVLVERPHHLVDRDPSRRCLAQPAVGQPLQPVFLVAPPPAAELPLRTAQKLSGLGTRQLPVVPALQQLLDLLHPAILQQPRPVHRTAPSGTVLKPDNSCATEPDNSCAYDTRRKQAVVSFSSCPVLAAHQLSASGEKPRVGSGSGGRSVVAWAQGRARARAGAATRGRREVTARVGAFARPPRGGAEHDVARLALEGPACWRPLAS
jgi:hypothetical protein